MRSRQSGRSGNASLVPRASAASRPRQSDVRPGARQSCGWQNGGYLGFRPAHLGWGGSATRPRLHYVLAPSRQAQIRPFICIHDDARAASSRRSQACSPPLTDETLGRRTSSPARRKIILASWLGFRGRVGCGASRYDRALLVEHVPDRCYGQPFTKRPLHTIGAEFPLGEHCPMLALRSSHWLISSLVLLPSSNVTTR